MGGRDVMTIMKWMHRAWIGCIIGNRAKPGNQLVLNKIPDVMGYSIVAIYSGMQNTDGYTN